METTELRDFIMVQNEQGEFSGNRPNKVIYWMSPDGGTFQIFDCFIVKSEIEGQQQEYNAIYLKSVLDTKTGKVRIEQSHTCKPTDGYINLPVVDDFTFAASMISLRDELEKKYSNFNYPSFEKTFNTWIKMRADEEEWDTPMFLSSCIIVPVKFAKASKGKNEIVSKWISAEIEPFWSNEDGIPSAKIFFSPITVSIDMNAPRIVESAIIKNIGDKIIKRFRMSRNEPIEIVKQYLELIEKTAEPFRGSKSSKNVFFIIGNYRYGKKSTVSEVIAIFLSKARKMSISIMDVIRQTFHIYQSISKKEDQFVIDALVSEINTQFEWVIRQFLIDVPLPEHNVLEVSFDQQSGQEHVDIVPDTKGSALATKQPRKKNLRTSKV